MSTTKELTALITSLNEQLQETLLAKDDVTKQLYNREIKLVIMEKEMRIQEEKYSLLEKELNKIKAEKEELAKLLDEKKKAANEATKRSQARKKAQLLNQKEVKKRPGKTEKK